jgi:methionine-rich copper-binding protein CopC
MLFAQNLRLNPGELSSAVFVRLTLNNSVILQMPAEDVRALRESEFTQVVFRLPTGLRPGTYTVQILAHTRLSNGGTIRIVP